MQRKHKRKTAEDRKKDVEFHLSLLDDLRETFRPAAGRRVLEHLVEVGMVFEGAFTGNSVTNYNEGGRDLVIGILDLVAEADIDTYLHVFKRRAEKIQQGGLKK